jgi:hypothetical protein
VGHLQAAGLAVGHLQTGRDPARQPQAAALPWVTSRPAALAVGHLQTGSLGRGSPPDRQIGHGKPRVQAGVVLAVRGVGICFKPWPWGGLWAVVSLPVNPSPSRDPRLHHQKPKPFQPPRRQPKPNHHAVHRNPSCKTQKTQPPRGEPKPKPRPTAPPPKTQTLPTTR